MKLQENLEGGGILGVINFSDWRYESLLNSPGYERQFLGNNQNAIYVPGKDIYVVKGQEIPTNEGHLLILGSGKGMHITEGRELEETIKEAIKQNTIVIADHPFSFSGLGRYLEIHPELLANLDAIEVHNGESLRNASRRALEFYEKFKPRYHNLGAISSSDGHSIYEIGSSWTDIEKPCLSDFIASLRNSIRKTNLTTPKKMKHSFFGAINHMASMTFIQFALRAGLKDFYLGKERPE